MNTLTMLLSFHMNYTAPQVSWNVPAGLQAGSRKLAFFLGVIWLVFFLSHFALPKRRNAMAQGQVDMSQATRGGATILVLLDLNLVSRTVNWFLLLVWWIASLIGIVS